MVRWIIALIAGTFGRLMGSPQLVYKLEDRLANSQPMRLLARTLVGLYQRGAWELRNIKSIEIDPKKLEEFKQMLKKK